MRGEPLTVHVPDDSEIAHVLEQVNTTPMRLESKGLVYRVQRESDDPFATYDPEMAREGMHAGAPDFDLVIGATCLEHDCTLVTRNYNHFSCITELAIYSPDK